MVEFYSEIRMVHIAMVIASGSLFMIRGIGLLANASWPRWAPLRYLTYAIDLVLLTAAMMLMTIIQQYPAINSWLTVKVVLLVVYIILGLRAFRPRPSKLYSAGFFVAALMTYGFIISVAISHHPLGFISYIHFR